MIAETMARAGEEFSIQEIAFDRYGDTAILERAAQHGLPMIRYSQGISVMGPGCQMWQQMWVGRKFVLGDDPVMRNACSVAIPVRDSNGNIKVNKAKRNHIIDPLVAAIMAVHVWGGEQRSVYADL